MVRDETDSTTRPPSGPGAAPITVVSTLESHFFLRFFRERPYDPAPESMDERIDASLQALRTYDKTQEIRYSVTSNSGDSTRHFFSDRRLRTKRRLDPGLCSRIRMDLEMIVQSPRTASAMRERKLKKSIIRVGEFTPTRRSLRRGERGDPEPVTRPESG
jgi:hypothetical protein